ncbi:serine/threonine-protein phosphatase [Parabacteroides merdae]|uniref:Serine/threonine-protein phosphatase n=1 Tax=Parabacteroides merdae TaxID=46503 RepID=A0A414XME8_9BACT|nr:PP2C family serine/threonine-protein phosphatase [Parabacteroides merdae]RGZ44606.1 serine/threonine-protein phosphatase [Parabacteroides merdae]RHH75076.1 serine/threonine-protein phosphatase [Parabacteroides merdae]
MGETNNNPFKFKLGAQTNVGCVRTNNEDNFVVSADLNAGEWLLPRDCHTVFTLGNKGAMLVVADGMGGLDAGEIASRMAVDTMKEFFSADKITDEIVKDASTIRKYMYDAVVAADNAIKRKSREEKGGKSMGTTLVAAWLFDGYANIIWCGDSRGYLFNPVSGLAQVTKDHSYVQELVDSGRLLPEYAFDHPDSNIITRSLGNPQKAANPDFVRLPLQEGEVILLCTDGLNSMLRDEEIEAVMQETSNEIDTCTKALIQGALDLGGHDNVTVVLCQIVPEENKPSVQDMQQTVSTFTEKERKKPLRKFILWTVAFVFVLLLLLACLAWSFSTAWQNKIIQWYEQTVK